jgi:hypothetical protein
MGRPPGALPRILTCLAFLGIAPAALAGPPFFTDDPEPLERGHFEAYLFGSADRAAGGNAYTLPGFELNFGATSDLMLHLIVPAALATPDRRYGLGDTEVGVKYRFLTEKGLRPEIGTFPQIEIPTGDAARGLGNGRLRLRLPLWLQKTSGPWTTYGGAGYEINWAPGMRNSVLAGWLLQRQFGKRLFLGGEVFHQGAQAEGARHTTFANGGGALTLRGGLSLLFMAGHTVSGESHTVGYLALYYTWGTRRLARQEPCSISRMCAILEHRPSH